MEEKKIEIDSKVIEEEYVEHLPGDDDEMYFIKEAISKLSPLQRKIYVTYLEAGSYAETARVFKVSVPTVQKYIKNISARIAEYVFDNMK